MSSPEKPNVEVEDPAKKPSLEDLGAGPAERAVFGSHGGMHGFVQFGIGIAALLLVFGLLFVYLLN